MSKKREAIRSNLAAALSPPPRKRSAELDGLLEEYAPPERDKGRPAEQPQTVPTSGTPKSGIPNTGIPTSGMLAANSLTADHGYYPTFNDLDDHVIPTLKPPVQSVLRRLYRLSRGFRSQECVVGLGALATACNMARSQVQAALEILTSKNLICPLGSSQAGTKYKVLPELPGVPQKGIPDIGIPKSSLGIPNEEVSGIPNIGNNKKNKDLINTHTNIGGVRVGSRYSIEECRKYASHLQSTGQGITNPGGYATTIHRTGEADALIEAFLSPVAEAVDASQCPDCQGTGFIQREEDGQRGVSKCKHSKLSKTE